jgi:hypothetical protein
VREKMERKVLGKTRRRLREGDERGYKRRL